MNDEIDILEDAMLLEGLGENLDIPVFKTKEESNAFLIAVYTGKSKKEQSEEHLLELKELADTCEMTVVGSMLCNMRKPEAAMFLSTGKLEEAKELADKLGAGSIIFDDYISPSQQRNLEKFFNRNVIDRTELIINIFSKRAKTAEARLQVELAKSRYMMPRLKRLWGHLSRQRGGGGFQKGEGEKQIELDRRMLKERIERLTSRLKAVKKQRILQRKSRERVGIPTFAIIGYTNAGKSSLLNLLTDAGVLAENKLFATLDPKTKLFALPCKQEVLLTDTVGFVRKLPHNLIAAFKSTLESTLKDDFLIHIVDVSNNAAAEHVETTYNLLQELNIKDPKIITVLNKIDLCEDTTLIDKLRLDCPYPILVSVKDNTGIDDLLEVMEKLLSKDRKVVTLSIPFSEYDLVSELINKGLAIDTKYLDEEIIIEASLPVEIAYRFEKYKI